MSLSVLGLDPSTEQAYRSLLADPQAHPPARAQRERLTELGLLDADGAARPPIALQELADAMSEQMLQRQREIAVAREHIAQIGVPPSGDRDGGVERLASAAAVRERLDELSFYARSSIYAVQPGPASPTARAAAERMDGRCVRRGLDLRVLSATPVAGCAGVAVRTATVLVERLIVIDRSIAVVPDDDSDGGLVLTCAPVVRRLVGLFEQWWDAAGLAVAAPPADDLDLARRLAAGGTDEQIARDLHISPRQLRRRISRLMQHSGTSSRFATGVAIGRAGWCR